MTGDRLRPSIFEGLPAEAKGNIPLLLDFVYGEVMHKIGILETGMKGRLTSHEEELKRVDKRIKKVENCPCAVHRDPAHTCIILDMQQEMAALRTENTTELNAIKTRLAWLGGGLAVVIFLLDLAFRVVPEIWRRYG